MKKIPKINFYIHKIYNAISRLVSKRSQVFFFLFLWIGGYTFFLTSRLWIPEDLKNLKHTPFYEEQIVDGRRTKLMRAGIDKDRGIVLIEMEIKNYHLMEHNVDTLEIKDTNFRKVPYRVLYLDDEYLVFILPASHRFKSIYIRGFYKDANGDLQNVFQTFVTKGKNLIDEKISLNRSQEDIYADRYNKELFYLDSLRLKKVSEIKELEKSYDKLSKLIKDFHSKESDLTEEEKKIFRLEMAKNESDLESIDKDIQLKNKEKKDLDEKFEQIKLRSKEK